MPADLGALLRCCDAAFRVIVAAGSWLDVSRWRDGEDVAAWTAYSAARSKNVSTRIR
jgi:hypothetical protein